MTIYDMLNTDAQECAAQFRQERRLDDLLGGELAYELPESDVRDLVDQMMGALKLAGDARNTAMFEFEQRIERLAKLTMEKEG